MASLPSARPFDVSAFRTGLAALALVLSVLVLASVADRGGHVVVRWVG